MNYIIFTIPGGQVVRNHLQVSNQHYSTFELIILFKFFEIILVPYIFGKKVMWPFSYYVFSEPWLTGCELLFNVSHLFI